MGDISINQDYKDTVRKRAVSAGSLCRTIKLAPPGSNVQLTPKQELFCLEYTDPKSAGYMNGINAYYLSYSDKCTPATARTEASRLVKRPNVQERLAELIWGGDPKVVRRNMAHAGLKDLLLQRRDLTNLRGAIDMVHKLDGEYKEEENKIVVNVVNFKDILGNNDTVQSGFEQPQVSVGDLG